MNRTLPLLLVLSALLGACTDRTPLDPLEGDDPPFAGWQVEHGPELTAAGVSVVPGTAGTLYATDGRTLWALEGRKLTQRLDISGIQGPMWGMPSGEVYLAGAWSHNRNLLYRFEGSHLHSLTLPLVGEEYVSSVWAASPTEIYVQLQGRPQRILRYDGASWRDIGWPAPGAPSWSIWGSGPNSLFAMASHGVYHWDGTRWRDTGLHLPGPPNDMWGPSANDLFAVGGSGVIVRYDGTAWAMMESGTRDRLNAVWGSSPNRVYAVGDAGTILRFDGARWQPMTSPTREQLTSVWGDGERVLAAGARGVVLALAGDRWEVLHSAPDLSGVWAASARAAFAVGTDGTILRRSGRSWERQQSGTLLTLRDVWGVSEREVYAVGDSGVALRFDGSRWTRLQTGVTENLLAIRGRSATEIYAVGAGGLMLRYNGVSWQRIATGRTENLGGIGIRDRDVLVTEAHPTGGSGVLLSYDGTAVRQIPIPEAAHTRLLSIGAAGEIAYVSGSRRLPTWRGPVGFRALLVGDQWQELPDACIAAYWVPAPNLAFAAGCEAVFRIERESGVAIGPPSPLHPRMQHTGLQGIWGISPTELFVVGSGGVILHGRL